MIIDENALDGAGGEPPTTANGMQLDVLASFLGLLFSCPPPPPTHTHTQECPILSIRTD